MISEIKKLIRETLQKCMLPWIYLSLYKNRRISKSEELVDLAFNSYFKMILPYQIKSEILELMALLRKHNVKNFMEIGTCNGGTLYLIARTLGSNAKVHSIDLPEGRFGGGYPAWKSGLYRRFADSSQTINLMRMDSHHSSTHEKVRELFKDDLLDCLFIDGDHSYDGVKSDFQYYKKFVKTGGMIIFHDIVPNSDDPEIEVPRFWNEIKDKYRYCELVDNWKQNRCGIGVLFKND